VRSWRFLKRIGIMPATNDATRRSWNLGLLIGPKPPLKPKHIWAIRTRLQH
jgi:hypothetical protein